jgi:hypothetical protein
MIPSFFEAIIELERMGRSFAVIFRTFGVDIPKIAEEWNLFCDGKHPSYPGRILFVPFKQFY